jgi:glutamyl-tRNA synthetase
VHKGGAHFDFEKAKWFNHEWIKRTDANALVPDVRQHLEQRNMEITDTIFLENVIQLVKDRCTLLTDFYDQSVFFFQAPTELDTAAVKPKWNTQKEAFFKDYAAALPGMHDGSALALESAFKQTAEQAGIKPGELQLPFRIMLVGGKFGPPVFEIAALLGPEETARRIGYAMETFR